MVFIRREVFRKAKGVVMEEKIGFTAFAIVIGLILSALFDLSLPLAIIGSIFSLGFFWVLFFVFFG